MHEHQLIWRRVTSDREQIEPHAPEGYEAVVEVHVLGRSEPVVPHYVETRSDGWVRLQCAAGPDRNEGKWDPENLLLHVRDEAITRIEIRLRPRESGRLPIGFSHAAAPADA